MTTNKNMPERDLDSILNLTQRMRELKMADIYGIWDWDSEAFGPCLTLIEFDIDSKHKADYLTRWANELRTLALERLNEKQDLSGLNNNAINTLVESLAYTDEIIHLREKRLMQKVKEEQVALEESSLSSPPTPPHLTPRPSAYDIPPADSIYAAKVSDLVQSEQSDCEPDIVNVLAHEFTLLRQAIDSLPRLIAEQLKQPLMTLQQNPNPFIPHPDSCECPECCEFHDQLRRRHEASKANKESEKEEKYRAATESGYWWRASEKKLNAEQSIVSHIQANHTTCPCIHCVNAVNHPYQSYQVKCACARCIAEQKRRVTR